MRLDRLGPDFPKCVEARALADRHGEKAAIDELTFAVRPSQITRFFEANWPGGPTAIQMIKRWSVPGAGRMTVEGRKDLEHAAPLGEVGALLEGRAVHAGYSAYNLRPVLTRGIPRRRVEEVIELVGLRVVAERADGLSRCGGQRPGIPVAQLADPAVLEESVNDLYPQDILWIRTRLRGLASWSGRVFVSSRLMSEMALTADHLSVVGRGRLTADTSVR